jgi:DNA-binding SARP family transcriptional activator/tetratricopeptide (TPR) repeat protein
VGGFRDPLEICLLGGFSVRVGTQAMAPLPSRTARLLLSYLALHPRQPQPRSVLADLFWPDVDESRGRRRLSHALWELQDGLTELAPGCAYLEATPDQVTFDGPAPYWLDVDEFETRLDDVDRSGLGDPQAERNLRRCVELYRGDVLAGHYEPWVTAEQQRLELRYLAALTQLVEVCRRRGNLADALTFARRVTHQDPLREDGHREVMRLFVLLGQPGQALDQYERCRSVLAEELGAEPTPETVRLYEQIAAARSSATVRPPRPRQLVTDRLIGRAAQRTSLVDALEHALAGRSGAVLLEGPPGVGKSQLLAQAADDASWRGFMVTWGACSEAAARTAYAPIRTAIEQQLHPVRVAQLEHAVDPIWMRHAARVLPGLARSDEGNDGMSSVAPGVEQADTIREALCQVLVELARLEPVLLVIDDVQWADPETLALLAQLLRRSHEGRLLLLLGYRDQEARQDEAVWAGLRMLDRASMPQRMTVGPLSAFELAELVREVLDVATVPPSFAAAMHRESGGNPLYALELLRALRDAGTLTDATVDQLDAVEVPITDGLRTVVARRLEALRGPAARAVEAAAVVGPDLSLPVLAACCGLEGHELTRALTVLLETNIIEPVADGYRFTHDVTRRVIVDGLAPARRRALHRNVARALQDGDLQSPEEVAFHLLEAGQSRQALPHLQAAADRAIRMGAYETAEAHLAQAIQAASTGPVSVDLRYGLLLQHEEILDILGRRRDQAAVLEQLGALAAGRSDRDVEVLLRRAVHLGHMDRLDEAGRAATLALRRASKESPTDRGRAAAVLGQLQSWAGSNRDAIRTLRGALADLPADGSDTGRAHFALGTALRFVQDYERAESHLRRALDVAGHLQDEPGVVRARGALADLHTESGQWELALAEYDEAITSARRLGYRQREAVGLVNRGNLQQSRGSPVDALESYSAAEHIFEELDSQRGVAMVRLNRAWLRHRWLGQDREARDDADRARAHFAAVGNDASEAVCMETLAAIARRQGYVDDSRTQLMAALELARTSEEHRVLAQVHRGLAATCVESNDPDAAAGHLRDALAIVTQFGMHDLDAELRAQHARVLAGQGREEQAWQEASRALAGLDHALEPHRVLHVVGMVAIATGHADDANRCIQLAHSRLMDAVTGLDPTHQHRALTVVRSHRAICDAATSAIPRTLARPIARDTAPRGRPLSPDDQVVVDFELGPAPSSAEERRDQVHRVLQQARQAHAVPTVADLADIFGVSSSTIHRDLRALRANGFDATTRGTGVG